MTLHDIRTLARKRPEQEFLVNRLYGAHVSPFFTWICLRLGLAPDQVTILGGAFGAAGVAILFLPLGVWSIVAVLCLQVGYILDFSDGQVARLTGRTSVAGSYLDWLTHFYIPVPMAMAASASVAWVSGSMIFIALGILAGLELAAFAFSCKEHVLIAMQRDEPALASTAGFLAALRDDARPADLNQTTGTVADSGIAGRAHSRSLRSIIGEMLIYPGSVHLITLAVSLDLALQAFGISPAVFARGALVGLWAALFPFHLFSTARRNHGLIAALEAQRAREADASDA